MPRENQARVQAAAAAEPAATPTLARKAPVAEPAPRANWITPARVGFLLAAVALWIGYSFPTEKYLTPERGIGYALGIIGGSLHAAAACCIRRASARAGSASSAP